MATTTPNFGWAVPTSTDLVKDGAVAIETLGDSIDASLVDLKGGTTGQVLAKASNTDMDFVWSADAAGISPTIVNAKGDIIGASANDTPAITSVGADGSTLVADSASSTGLRWQGSYPAGKNLLINGLLDIWQRSTSVTGQANGYATIDRWYLVSSASCTFAQETTVVPAGCRYSQKVTVGASASSTQAYQAVETSNVVAYAGQNVSFSARFQSSATPTISLVVEYSTTVDYPLASGSWVAITATSGGSGSAGSASFSTISGVYAIPSTAKSLRFSFNSSSMASGSILYYGGFQAELGVVVTSLTRNATTLQGELAACQRYFIKVGGDSVNDRAFAAGIMVSTTNAKHIYQMPVQMRTAPSATFSAAGTFYLYGGGVAAVPSAIASSSATTQNISIDATRSATTQNLPSFLQALGTANAFIDLSAEL